MYKMIVEWVQETGEIATLQLQWVLAVFTDRIAVGVDEAALAQLPPGEYPLSKLPYLWEEGLFVLLGDGLAHRYAAHTLFLDFDGSQPLRGVFLDASQNSGKYMVSGGQLVINPAWQEPTFMVEKPEPAPEPKPGQRRTRRT